MGNGGSKGEWLGLALRTFFVRYPPSVYAELLRPINSSFIPLEQRKSEKFLPVDAAGGIK